jgi:hypothetical protein
MKVVLIEDHLYDHTEESLCWKKMGVAVYTSQRRTDVLVKAYRSATATAEASICLA